MCATPRILGRRTFSGADDDVRRPTRTVEEVPRPKRDLLAFDEQQALTLEYEKALVVPLPVIEAHRLSRQEPVEVDPDLTEWSLALEVAVRAKRAPVAPAALACVEDEPAVAVGSEPEPCLPERSLGHGARHAPGSRVTG